MKASFVDLRKKSGQIIRALRRNEQVTVLYRGKPAAVMRPVTGEAAKARARAGDHAAFGLWADRDEIRDADAYVRNLRKGRFSDL